MDFYSYYATIAGRFCRRGIVIILTIHSISGYTCLYWVFMQLYVYSLHSCSNFQRVISFLKCLINHSFSFLSGFIKWVILLIILPRLFSSYFCVLWLVFLLSQWYNSGTVLCWTWSLWEDEWLLQVGCHAENWILLSWTVAYRMSYLFSYFLVVCDFNPFIHQTHLINKPSWTLGFLHITPSILILTQMENFRYCFTYNIIGHFVNWVNSVMVNKSWSFILM